MTQLTCTCGYQAADPDDLTVHFGEMFIPADDIAADGQVHAEVIRPAADARPAPGTLTCRCGFTSSVSEFDQHLADIFTPADRTGLDGRTHAPSSPQGQRGH